MIRTNVRDSSIDLLWVFGTMLPTIWLLRPVSMTYAGSVGLLIAMGIATWRLMARGQTWTDVGVARPESLQKLANATVGVFVLALVLGTAATVTLTALGFEQVPADVDSWEGLEGNLPYFLFRLVLAWGTSFSEEFIFRGLLISKLDEIFGGTTMSLILIVVFQACFFGYMHYATQGTFGAFSAGGRGLAMGIGYIAFKRNLWPLVIVHVALNTIALTEIFLGE